MANNIFCSLMGAVMIVWAYSAVCEYQKIELKGLISQYQACR